MVRISIAAINVMLASVPFARSVNRGYSVDYDDTDTIQAEVFSEEAIEKDAGGQFDVVREADGTAASEKASEVIAEEGQEQSDETSRNHENVSPDLQMIMAQAGVVKGVSGEYIDSSKQYFVILDTFRVAKSSNLLWSIANLKHTEITFCDRANLNEPAIQELSVLLHNAQNRGSHEIPKLSWSTWYGMECKTMWYGGFDDPDICSGVRTERTYLSRDSSDGGAVSFTAENSARKYVYGTTDSDIVSVRALMCCKPEGLKWRRSVYHATGNNCNTFTMRVLQCGVGLGYDLPSDITVSHPFPKMKSEGACPTKC